MNSEAVFLHFPFWQTLEPFTVRLHASHEQILAAVRQAWIEQFPLLPLPEVNS